MVFHHGTSILHLSIRRRSLAQEIELNVEDIEEAPIPSEARRLGLAMMVKWRLMRGAGDEHTHIYIYIYMYICVYIYIYGGFQK